MKNYYIYKKLGHFVKNCYKVKKGNKENINNACDNFGGNDYAFMASKGTSMAAMSKQIIDLDATKYMVLYQYSFDIYKSILETKVLLGNNNMLQAIRIGFIVGIFFVKDQIKRIKLKEVLHISKTKKLLLVSTLISYGCKV